MKIAILSRKASLYSTRRLMEAGKQRGHEVRVIDTLRCYMNITSRRPQVLLGGDHARIARWRRDRITVRPREGWRPNTMYRVELLPGVSDLRNNRATTGASAAGIWGSVTLE